MFSHLVGAEPQHNSSNAWDHGALRIVMSRTTRHEETKTRRVVRITTCVTEWGFQCIQDSSGKDLVLFIDKRVSSIRTFNMEFGRTASPCFCPNAAVTQKKKTWRSAVVPSVVLRFGAFQATASSTLGLGNRRAVHKPLHMIRVAPKTIAGRLVALQTDTKFTSTHSMVSEHTRQTCCKPSQQCLGFRQGFGAVQCKVWTVGRRFTKRHEALEEFTFMAKMTACRQDPFS